MVSLKNLVSLQSNIIYTPILPIPSHFKKQFPIQVASSLPFLFLMDHLLGAMARDL